MTMIKWLDEVNRLLALSGYPPVSFAYALVWYDQGYPPLWTARALVGEWKAKA